MSYDALMTEAGKQASWLFIRDRRFAFLLDESQRIKSPALTGKNRVERTAVTAKIAPYSTWRRAASGTPMDTPLDIYSQVRWLDPEFWSRELGLGSFAAFRAHFATTHKGYNTVNTPRGPKQVEFDVVDGYRNLDQLEQVLAKVSTRILKENVLDLPEKTYKRMRHELTTAQRTAYEGLRQEAIAFLESGAPITVEYPIQLDLRLTQIASGFLTAGPGCPAEPFTPNPRAALFREVLRDLTSPAILWGRFRHDVEGAVSASRAAGRRPVVFDGARPGDALDAFTSGAADDIVANLSSGMIEGFTLTRARAVLYWSNSPKLITRLQSEDRAHRIGQRNPVTYYDFVAEGTRDARRLDRLQSKRRSTGEVFGEDQDALRAFLREVIDDVDD
jgi:hypothetical protein